VAVSFIGGGNWSTRTYILLDINFCLKAWGRRGHDRMVVEFTTTYAINAYRHLL
jgi:hypothetical protein